jgi:hypothetical protein
VFIDWRHIGELLSAGREIYSEVKNVCVWVKSNAGMGSLYRSQHELVVVFKHGHQPHRNNVQLGQCGRNRTNVWHYPSAGSHGRVGEEGNLLALHPTLKPVALVADAIMDCTARNEIVLDGFLGSGTTVIAAERTGRICHGLELDPLYVDTVIRRWQAFSRDNAATRSAARPSENSRPLSVMPTDSDYPVGYGRPPRQTRFRKGQSGNPVGRPRGAQNLATLIGKAHGALRR